MWGNYEENIVLITQIKNCSGELSLLWPFLCGVEKSSSHWAAAPWRIELTWMMRVVMMFKWKTPCPSVCIYIFSAFLGASVLSSALFSSCKHGQVMSDLFFKEDYIIVLYRICWLITLFFLHGSCVVVKLVNNYLLLIWFQCHKIIFYQ